MRGATEQLHAHHSQRSEQKRGAVLTAARAMIRSGRPIEWVALAERAGVSEKFIHDRKHADIKAQVKEMIAVHIHLGGSLSAKRDNPVPVLGLAGEDDAGGVSAMPARRGPEKRRGPCKPTAHVLGGDETRPGPLAVDTEVERSAMPRTAGTVSRMRSSRHDRDCQCPKQSERCYQALHRILLKRTSQPC
jgi:hypothetical protein